MDDYKIIAYDRHQSLVISLTTALRVKIATICDFLHSNQKKADKTCAY